MFRIYVASLSDYNAGRLHGNWVTVDDGMDEGDLWNEIQKILDSSPEAKITGFPAEEWAIHDFEIPYGIEVSEWESMERLIVLNDRIDEIRQILEQNNLEDFYGGEIVESVGGIDYISSSTELMLRRAEDFFDFFQIPEKAEPYIDTKAWLRDVASENSGFWIDSSTFVGVY